MPKIIIDASATLDWLYDDSNGASAVGPLLLASDLIAPTLWLLEVTNSILNLERRRRFTIEQGAKLLGVLDSLDVELVPEPLRRTATGLAQIARPHQLSSYDAVYLDLAVRLDLPLLTRDKYLRTAAGRTGVELVQETI